MGWHPGRSLIPDDISKDNSFRDDGHGHPADPRVSLRGSFAEL